MATTTPEPRRVMHCALRYLLPRLRPIGLTCLIGLIGLIASGCQTANVMERLDRDSGLTVATDKAPVAFAHTDARISRSARDYVYLGPVEVNERGTRQYYLWVGLASTIDRSGFADAAAAVPTHLYVTDDGIPIELSLAPWGEREPRLAGRDIYSPAVAPDLILAARVTLDQLERLERTAPERIALAADDGRSVEYFIWKRSGLWPNFLDYAGAGPGR